ncbi:MAG: response regulator [Desulfobulbaceae bacterium]|nr:MAG: response regulator [Desulfobulbaceae bacterium]
MTRFSDKITLFIVFFFLAFIGIAVLFVRHEAITDLRQLQIHATIIADDVWAVNPAGADPYLQLAMKVNSYKNLVVTQLGGEPFTNLTSPPLPRFEQLLFKLKLIWLRNLSTDIMFNGQKIGEIHGEKYVKVVYPLTNILILLLLVMLTAIFVAYLYSNRKYLEQQILQRTKNLQESERRFHDLVNLLPEMVWEASHSGQLIYANQIAMSRLGLDDVKNQPASWLDFVAPDQHSAIAKYFSAILNGHDPGLREFRLKDNDDGEFPALLRAAPIVQDADIVGVRIIAIDISERQALEEQLRRAQKMKAIGLMAGGVAHDLNNILSGIVNYPELMLIDLPDSSPLRRPLEAIRKSGIQAAEVVSDLLTVARGVAAVKVVVDPQSLIHEYLDSPEFFQLSAYNPHMLVKTEFSRNISPISCSPTHVKKCLMNLVTNAAEAMNGQGTITISTANRTITNRDHDSALPPPGDYSVIMVKDNGPGIQPTDLKHIFEPFYTKKTMGRSGTGLGLAVVWNTMMDHEGAVTVASDKNGTVFSLLFQSTRENYSTARQAIDLAPLRGRGETILVVDDEEQQRDITAQLLNNLGYNATTAASGEEAVALLQKIKVDLIILDMIMYPGINGRETYEKIIAIHPGQKAIISSGFSQDTEVKAAQHLGAGGFICKPYTMEQLGKAVYDELHA